MSLLLPLLLWTVTYGEVLSQYPRFWFMGEILGNHTYVDLSRVSGPEDGGGILCQTNLATCCSSVQGNHRGDWYYPNGTTVPTIQTSKIYAVIGNRFVKVYQMDNPNSPSGIYRCDIPTLAVHDTRDTSVRESVYVGMYATGGMF